MFGRVPFLGSTEKSIVVETLKGRRISNQIAPEPEFRGHEIYRKALKAHVGPVWRERKTATGGYNCAGHVWASRRTALYDSTEWRLILEDDGYAILPGSESAVFGDLALYVRQDNDEIWHVAQFIDLRLLLTGGSNEPWLLSKLNDRSGEVMHYACFLSTYYRTLGYETRVEYWTDRAAN